MIQDAKLSKLRRDLEFKYDFDYEEVKDKYKKNDTEASVA